MGFFTDHAKKTEEFIKNLTKQFFSPNQITKYFIYKYKIGVSSGNFRLFPNSHDTVGILNFYTIKFKIMKTLLLLLGVVTTTSCLSQTSVPSAVESSFTKLFARTAVKKWDKEEGKHEA